MSASDTQITPFTTPSPRAGFPGNDVAHLRIASPAPRAGIARKSPCGGESRYTFGGMTHSPVACRTKPSRTSSTASAAEIALRTVSWSYSARSGTAADDTLRLGLSRNGRKRPPRPRIEVRQANTSPEEAAAIAAAIEQFLRDTAPPPAAREEPLNPWLRTALFEGVGLAADAPSPWTA